MNDDRRGSQERTILIVDDHPVLRHGMRELLAREPGIKVCGEAASARDALRLAETLSPDLAIVDISLPETSGIDLIKRLRAQFPKIQILVSSMHDEAHYASRALHAGAMGYVSKQEPASNLLDAIRIVLCNQMYVSPAMTARMFRWKRSGEKSPVESPAEELSDRELEVFEAIGRGRGTREIAKALALSVKTIETHRENIKRKLSLASNTELIQRSFRWILEKE